MDNLRVLLVGGPESLSEGERVREVTDLSEKVKVVVGAG